MLCPQKTRIWRRIPLDCPISWLNKVIHFPIVWRAQAERKIKSWVFLLFEAPAKALKKGYNNNNFFFLLYFCNLTRPSPFSNFEIKYDWFLFWKFNYFGFHFERRFLVFLEQILEQKKVLQQTFKMNFGGLTLIILMLKKNVVLISTHTEHRKTGLFCLFINNLCCLF